MNWEFLGYVLGCLLIVEGIGPLLFPNRWQRYVERLAQSPLPAIRQTGLWLTLTGLFLVIWLQFN